MKVSHEMSVGLQEVGAAGFKWLVYTGSGSARTERKPPLHTMIEQPLQLEEFRVLVRETFNGEWNEPLRRLT